MNKEIIITIIFIVIVIAGEIISNNYTEACVGETNQKLSQLKATTINKEVSDEELKNQAENLFEEWKNKRDRLAYYIEHDELEKVDTHIKAATADYEVGLTDEAVPEIEQSIYVLKHIQEKKSLKLKNIF